MERSERAAVVPLCSTLGSTAGGAAWLSPSGRRDLGACAVVQRHSWPAGVSAWWQEAVAQRRCSSGSDSIAALLCRPWLGAGEREGERKGEVEREERSTFLTHDFLKILCGNSKNFQHESCRKLQRLQLLF